LKGKEKTFFFIPKLWGGLKKIDQRRGALPTLGNRLKVFFFPKWGSLKKIDERSEALPLSLG
jgi:hypothetical protein